MIKTALVTGGSSGIGRETAIAFARAGYNVVVADICGSTGEEVVKDIKKTAAKAIFIRTDVTSSAEVENLIQVAVDTYGRIDCAFNNAGVASREYGAIDEFSEGEWDRIISINLKGIWLCLKHECRQMLKQGEGAIVNTSSIMGKVSGPGLSGYSASKAGVIGLTQSVALDYAKRGIRVNAICPGGINTPMTANPQMREILIQATPMGRMGEPSEIANTVLWLCSDNASFITGQSIMVDGGFLAI